MNKITLRPDALFDGNELHQQVAVTFCDGHVTAIEPDQGQGEAVAGLLVPGFIDVQVNGGGGALFNHQPTIEGLKTMALAHAQFGTTAMLPTLITDSVEVMEQAADAVSDALKQQLPGIIGIHFEGPHLSLPKKGTHSEPLIRPISEAEMAIFSRDDLGIKVITLAPENVSDKDIRRLVAADVKICLGHSNATYERTCEALDAGATGFTHLYNAMSPLASRDPGMVGAALQDSDSWCGLIVDGHHVHAGAMKVSLAAKPRGKMLLVTDAMSLLGTNKNEFAFFDRTVYRRDGRLNSSTGELAGSDLDMASAVRNTVNWLDVSLPESLRMAALYPAEFVGSQTHGRIAVGSKADFTLLDDQQQVLGTWIGGQPVYTKQT